MARRQISNNFYLSSLPSSPSHVCPYSPSSAKSPFFSFFFFFFDTEKLFLKHGPQLKKSAPARNSGSNFIDLADAFGPLSSSNPQQPQHHSHPLNHSAPVTSTTSNPLGELDFLSGMSSQTVQPQRVSTNTSYASFPAPPQQQPYITTIQQPSYSSYPSQPQAYPTNTPVPATQNTYVNPFFDTPSAAVAPAKQGGNFDEFDMLANSRHPVAKPVPLVPSSPSLSPQSLYLFFFF